MPYTLSGILPRPGDTALQNAIREQVSIGVPLRYAAINAGISEDVAYQWRSEGEAALAEGRVDSPHAAFAKMLKEAEAACVVDSVTNWREAKVNDWQRWATLLQRRYPSDFSERVTVDQRTVSITVSVSLDQLPQDALPALQSIISRRMGTPPLALTDGGATTDSEADTPGTGT